MNQEKMGKFIANVRKEKQLTQEQLAEILNVDRTTISKWERGVSAPDISLLQQICNALDITITELLNYKKGIDTISSKDNTIEAIKFYNKHSKKKYFYVFITALIILTITFITGILINKYNKFDIYDIRTDNQDFSITGYYFKNKKRDIIIIKNIDYNDIYVGTTKEIKTDNFEISLLSNNQIIYNYEITYDNEEYLDNILDNISFYYDSSKSEEDKPIKIDESNLSLNIEIKNSKENSSDILIIKLVTE